MTEAEELELLELEAEEAAAGGAAPPDDPGIPPPPAPAPKPSRKPTAVETASPRLSTRVGLDPGSVPGAAVDALDPTASPRAVAELAESAVTDEPNPTVEGLRAFSEGATLGLAPRLNAALGAVPAGVSAAVRKGIDEPASSALDVARAGMEAAGEEYETLRPEFEAQQHAASEAQPGAKLAGAAMVPIPGPGKASGLPAIAKTALGGAAAGAIQGAAESDAPLLSAETGKEALKGGAIGFGVGGLAGLGIAGLKALASSNPRRLLEIIGFSGKEILELESRGTLERTADEVARVVEPGMLPMTPRATLGKLSAAKGEAIGAEREVLDKAAGDARTAATEALWAMDAEIKEANSVAAKRSYARALDSIRKRLGESLAATPTLEQIHVERMGFDEMARHEAARRGPIAEAAKTAAGALRRAEETAAGPALKPAKERVGAFIGAEEAAAGPAAKGAPFVRLGPAFIPSPGPGVGRYGKQLGYLAGEAAEQTAEPLSRAVNPTRELIREYLRRKRTQPE